MSSYIANRKVSTKSIDLSAPQIHLLLVPPFYFWSWISQWPKSPGCTSGTYVRIVEPTGLRERGSTYPAWFKPYWQKHSLLRLSFLAFWIQTVPGWAWLSVSMPKPRGVRPKRHPVRPIYKAQILTGKPCQRQGLQSLCLMDCCMCLF